MPRFLTPSGLYVWVPGVYTRVNAVVNTPGALPEFLVPFLVGDGPIGIPYNVASLQRTHESYSWYAYRGTKNAVQENNGRASNLGIAMGYAKKHGLPGTYVVCASPLTRLAVIATSTAKAVDQMTVYPRLFGTPPGHTKIQITSGGALLIRGVKHFSMLTANAASTATRIYVTDNSWAVPGMSVEVGDNSTVNAAKVVLLTGEELTSTGQKNYWIEFTAAIGAALTTALYGLACFYDLDNDETATGITTAGAFFNYLHNTSKLLDAVVVTATYNAALAMDPVATATPIKDVTAWQSVTDGTSPASTSTDHDAIITLLDGGQYAAFALAEGKLPRAFCILSSSSTVHNSWGDWALTMRSDRGIAVSITTGGTWGDVDLSVSNDTNPTYRAANLNNQNVAIFGGGAEFRAAYLSTAPAVWALRVRGGIGHNLTWDELKFTSWETAWDEWNSGELTTLTRKGVITYAIRLAGGPPAYVVNQGLSTLQNNVNAWNDDDDTTCLVMQRDAADAVDAAMADAFGGRVGTDGVSTAGIAVKGRRKAEQLVQKGWLVDGSFSINSILLDATGNGYNVDWNGRTPPSVDFIGSTFNLLVGDDE